MGERKTVAATAATAATAALGAIAPVGARAQRREETRDALAAAALALFAARGFDATSVEEIALTAGVSRRTFFRYFASKEAAFFWPQQARLAEFRAVTMDHRPGDPPLGAIRRAALAMAMRYEAHREDALREHKLIVASASLNAYDAQLDWRWEQALREAFAADGADDLDARVGSGALLGVMRAVLRGWFETQGSYDLRERGVEALRRLAPLLDSIAARCDRSLRQRPPGPAPAHH